MSRSTASANTSTSPITSSPVNTPSFAPGFSTPHAPISISRAFLLRKAHFPGQDPQFEDTPPIIASMTTQPVQNGDPAVFPAAPSNLYNLQKESTIVASPRVFSSSTQPIVPVPTQQRVSVLRNAHFPGQDPQTEDAPPVTMTTQPVQNGDPAVFQAAPSNMYNPQTELTIVASPPVFSPSTQPIVPVPTQQRVSVLQNAHFPGQDPQSENASPTTTSMTTQPVQNGDPSIFPIVPAAHLNLHNLQTESTILARPRVFPPSSQPIVPGSFQQHVSPPIDTLSANSPTAMHKSVKFLAPLKPASFSPSAIGVPATVDERRWRNVAQPQEAIQTKVHTEQAREKVNDSDSNVSAAQTVQLRKCLLLIRNARPRRLYPSLPLLLF